MYLLTYIVPKPISLLSMLDKNVLIDYVALQYAALHKFIMHTYYKIPTLKEN
jgi:hypothetical protein